MIGAIGRFACLLAAGATLAALGSAAESPRTRDFELTYTATIGELPLGAHRVELWLPYPASDANQRVEAVAVSSPYPYEILKEPRFNNSILHVTVPAVREPEIAVTMKVRAQRQEYLRRAFPAAADPPAGFMSSALGVWLQPDRLVPLDDKIKALAREVTKGQSGDLAKARAIYDYVVSTMAYDKSGTGWGNGDIYWACDAKRGNCTDFHALFIGLSRAVGIPAKFEIGMPLPPERGQGEIAGYHCWAEFYLRGYGWVPVDASEARKHPDKREYFFGALDEDRLQFSVGRDLVLNPQQTGAPVNYFIYPYVEVDGQPYAKVAKKFLYQDRGEHAAAAR